MSDADDPRSLVLSEITDGVCLITLNRPERLNAMSPALLERYTDVLHASEADPQARVIVVTGAGKGFCAGADLALLAQGPDALEGFASEFDAEALFAFTVSMTTPVVMAINGAAAGAGFVLALTGDVRFASRQALFLSVFSRLGLTAEYGAAWLLPRVVGPARARELLLSGRPIDADEALRIGLVSGVSESALDAAMDWARDVAAHCSPASLAAMKSQFAAAEGSDLSTHLAESLEWMSRSFRWPDLDEALAARDEGRPPRFMPGADRD
jgi:enoyl-CoA hydratase/carnithine racemase